MQLLANENFPLDAVMALRAAGHDVLWVRTVFPGATDAAVLQRAVQEQRLLLTFDKDFGELAYRAKLPASCGIILFRLMAADSKTLAHWVNLALQSRDDWAGNFAVIESGRIRLRPLP